MASPQETALKEINPKLREEAILRAALVIKGAKLIASAMSEVWWLNTPGTNVSANTRASRGGFVLFPKMGVELIPTTESYVEPRKPSTTIEPIELETLRIVSYASHNDTVMLVGTTPRKSSLHPNHDQLPGVAFETVEFHPEEHELALYRDERR